MTQEYECHVCGGEMVVEDHQKYCIDCDYAPSGETSLYVDNHVDEWRKFWDERKGYDGDYGRDRKKCAGGFLGAY